MGQSEAEAGREPSVMFITNQEGAEGHGLGLLSGGLLMPLNGTPLRQAASVITGVASWAVFPAATLPPVFMPFYSFLTRSSFSFRM